jgi:hypothetical protein
MADVIKSTDKNIAQKNKQENLVQKVSNPLKTIKNYFGKRKFQKKNRWMGLEPGDLVEIEGNDYLYMGINSMGGPGMPGMAEPMLTTSYPTNPQTIYYFRPRQLSDVFPMNVFDEELPPYDVSGSSRKISFINGTNIKNLDT